jgi:O-antigen/teichoic acid export membrane protein
VLSYQIRHVDQRYNESGLIALSIYTAALIGLVAIVVNVTVPYSVNAEVAIICFGILIVIAVMVALIFGPKSWRIHVIKNTSHASSNNTTMASMSPSTKKSSTHKTSRDAAQDA